MSAHTDPQAITKGSFVEYDSGAGCRVLAVVRRAHRNGECTVESRFFLREGAEIVPGYLGYRFRIPTSELSRSEVAR
jgi:hypothetical protein